MPRDAAPDSLPRLAEQVLQQAGRALTVAELYAAVGPAGQRVDQRTFHARLANAARRAHHPLVQVEGRPVRFGLRAWETDPAVAPTAVGPDTIQAAPPSRSQARRLAVQRDTPAAEPPRALLEAALEALDARLGLVSETLGGVEQRLDALGRTVDVLRERLDSLEALPPPAPSPDVTALPAIPGGGEKWSVRLPPALIALTKAAAESRGIPPSRLVYAALLAYLPQEESHESDACPPA
jgi:hypothetical protein